MHGFKFIRTLLYKEKSYQFIKDNELILTSAIGKNHIF